MSCNPKTVSPVVKQRETWTWGSNDRQYRGYFLSCRVQDFFAGGVVFRQNGLKMVVNSANADSRAELTEVWDSVANMGYLWPRRVQCRFEGIRCTCLTWLLTHMQFVAEWSWLKFSTGTLVKMQSLLFRLFCTNFNQLHEITGNCKETIGIMLCWQLIKF